MIKNPHLLAALEKEERKQKNSVNDRENWYKKADQLYKTALLVNPELSLSNSEKHLEMLIEVRKKLEPMTS